MRDSNQKLGSHSPATEGEINGNYGRLTGLGEGETKQGSGGAQTGRSGELLIAKDATLIICEVPAWGSVQDKGQHVVCRQALGPSVPRSHLHVVKGAREPVVLDRESGATWLELQLGVGAEE